MTITQILMLLIGLEVAVAYSKVFTSIDAIRLTGGALFYTFRPTGALAQAGFTEQLPVWNITLPLE